MSDLTNTLVKIHLVYFRRKSVRYLTQRVMTDESKNSGLRPLRRIHCSPTSIMMVMMMAYAINPLPIM